MPRIATVAILQARTQHPLLPLLLRECRSLPSAKNELRWLYERALCIVRSTSKCQPNGTKQRVHGWRSLLKSMCLARSRGVPLQYILGDQPFGELDIKCTRGVLIPRHETEAITLHAAELILGRFSGMGRGDKPLRIIDLCTGTGCIPLLLHNLLSCHFSKLSIIGIDISATAVSLAQKNVERNVRMGKLSQRALTDVRFQRRNVLEYNPKRPLVMEDMCDYTSIFSNVSNSQIDVLISNPPYVSLEEYHDGTTSRSVRIFEPKLALVPPENISQFMVDSGDFRPEDFFYHHIAALMCALQVKLGVLECGSRLQAVRVAMICENIIHSYKGLGKGHVNIWSDTGMDTDPCAVIMQTWD